MKSFIEFLSEMDFGSIGKSDMTYGHPSGSTVKINEPGHEHHGQEGRVLRQMGHSFGVQVGNKLSWHNTKNLSQIKK